MPNQVFLPGQLEQPFQRELQVYLQQRIVQRLWTKDSSLWPKELEIHDKALARMDWLSLPEGIPQFLEILHRLFTAADKDGLLDHALPNLRKPEFERKSIPCCFQRQLPPKIGYLR
jgi:hypothetical protein